MKQPPKSCEGCFTGSIGKRARNRIAHELGINCTGLLYGPPEKAHFTPVPVVFGRALETTSRIVTCPLAEQLDFKLRGAGVSFNAREKLARLILSDSIASSTPLETAIALVAANQDEFVRVEGYNGEPYKVSVEVEQLLGDVASSSAEIFPFPSAK